MKEEKLKVSYEQIEKANKEIETIKLGSKGYAQVNERIKAYRKVYPTGSIETEIQEIKDDYIRIRTIVTDEEDKIIATGTASETNKGNNKVNLTSMIENCETSSVGRALGFAGFGVDTAIASAEDMERNKERSKQFEIYQNMFIRDEEAKYIIKVVIGDLMRKMGVVKAGLAKVVEDELWTTLEEMTTHQLLKLEYKLKTLNMEDNTWHHLYNENTKIKDVVPKGQEVVYESSWYKFGKMALEQAGTDELLRNDIINNYIEMGIRLVD
ncbi:MAG: hypothetical protein J6D28_04485 [Bacilli bacterium]|nr:hypothetical protein [Bacilli bacterium]